MSYRPKSSSDARQHNDTQQAKQEKASSSSNSAPTHKGPDHRGPSDAAKKAAQDAISKIPSWGKKG
jgi:hypothetical protein